MMMMQHDNNGYGRYGNCYTACSGGDNSSVVDVVVVNVTIEEPDDTSDLMLQLEESAPCTAAAAAAVPVPSVSYENHDLFYDHYDYDPLLYFAEYNQNNPIQTRNDIIMHNNEDDTDTDTLLMRESEEELQLCQGSFHHKNIMNTSFSSLEPISESDNEEEEEEEDAAEEGIGLEEEKEEEQ
eukprot:CAMPEP_0170776034 /NCGR_PEP_ID=MMETSP0733-20121128/10925_1 /TAXON_ID=186038 /ORGANISM="Fragilariopsis kerguelensis, Strain L26-C5" /LENGTH=181 /DNA_ID=CAMNT_0011118929 /DNA_START=68 /DNA_END=613 /DNA_ORIENTATION=+